MERAVAIAQGFAGNVALLGIANVDETRTKPMYYDGNLFYSNASIEKYNAVIEKVANRRKCGFIPLFGMMESHELEGGLHPTAAGHQKIFERVRVCMEKNKWIEPPL